jgi:hypothetical protein
VWRICTSAGQLGVLKHWRGFDERGECGQADAAGGDGGQVGKQGGEAVHRVAVGGGLGGDLFQLGFGAIEQLAALAARSARRSGLWQAINRSPG